MNPIALGLIALGIVLLLVGISSLKNNRTRGLVLSIAGALAIAIPFAATYLVAESITPFAGDCLNAATG